MWKDKLNEIIRELDAYGEKVNIGATEKETELFLEEIINEFELRLPDAYLEVLKFINGLEFNGFILYGIDEYLSDFKPHQTVNGFIECNKVWYENEWQKKYIFLGESSVAWYVYDLEERKYYELDNPSGSLMEEFDNPEDLLEKFMADALA